ncbi:MAG: hypothetical protein GX930_02680 [Clostridia bacterium]|nr:hypothetical protein [Clostridia bacterium]
MARIVAPLIVNLPIKMLYPTGPKQEVHCPKHEKYYREAEIIAGDFLFIKKHMPAELPEKTIITNTVTPNDIEDLKRRGVAVLVTTTPELNGRSFGTNVMEGVLVALAGKRPEELTPDNFNTLLDRIDFIPRIENLKLRKDA